MEKLSKKFDSGGWKCDYDMLAKGGLVIANVMHDGYNLARDIRVVAIWVYPVAGAPQKPEPKVFYLGTEDLPQEESADSTYKRWSNFNAPPPFDVYTKGGFPRGPAGLQARFKTQKKVFGDDTDDDDDFLLIEQSFIFTKYGKDPPHEPGGVLEAARVFPLIKFAYSGKKIKSIRVDYRFHVSLDIFLYRALEEIDPLLNQGLNALQGNAKKTIIAWLNEKRPMLAGIFRDYEVSPSSTDTEDIFYAVEKPVLWEVVGYGLKKGIPGERVSEETELPRVHGTPPSVTHYAIADDDKTTWDNIHLWANYRLGRIHVKKQPSTPGAFHALHCHWRWPFFIGEPDLGDRMKTFFGGIINSPLGNPLASALGAKQFVGIPLQGNIGGPLLDPKIPTQTIQFAITMAKPPANSESRDRWDAEKFPSEPVFEDLFIERDPRDIRKGEDIVTWFAITAENWNADAPDKKKFEGTMFVHGIFFAHNAELPWYKSPFAGTSGQELQKPAKPKEYRPTWLRSPNGK